MTQEQCESAVKALQERGFNASHVMGAPDDHGVWLDGVWNDDLQDTHSFRIHDEEIEWWGASDAIYPMKIEKTNDARTSTPSTSTGTRKISSRTQ